MSDELMHPVGDDHSWSESYYFNFVDPDSGIGMFTRMGFRPGNGWADALHAIYLDEHRVAFTYGRRTIEKDLSQYDGDLAAGDLTLTCVEPHQSWRIRYDGPAQNIADADVLLTRRKERPDGWFTAAHLTMDLTFECLTEPHYAASGERGHFEQSGRVTGTIRLDDEQWTVGGYGVRDKSWGPRDWGAGARTSGSGGSATPAETTGPRPMVNWFSMNFGARAALGGSCFRHPDGVMRGAGWLQRDGESIDLTEVVITTEYRDDPILHESVSLRATTESGEQIDIDGVVKSVCPTKIPMPGGSTFVNEGLTEFTWDGERGHGIAEHWHAVSIGD